MNNCADLSEQAKLGVCGSTYRILSVFRCAPCMIVERNMNRQFVEDFIKIYESEPCLWQTKCKEYHDRNKKDAGYARLTEKLKEIEPNATKDGVIKKINNLRSAYRKEKKKLNDSLKSGASADDVYKPKLWYFGMLR